MNALIGGREVRVSRYRKTFCCSCGLLGSLRISGCASGSLLSADPGVFASFVTPTYSEWSVTPMKSSGVSILMS